LKFHFAQTHAATRHEFIFVEALGRDLKSRCGSLLDELVLRDAKSAAQRASRAMPAARTSCSHKRDGNGDTGVLTIEARRLRSYGANQVP